MAPARHLGILFPDDLQTLDPRRRALNELRLADDGAGGVAVPGFDPAEVNGAAGREIGRDDHVAEAALPAIGDRGHARDILRRTIFLPEFQLARFLGDQRGAGRSEEHTSELQSLMRISYAV